MNGKKSPEYLAGYEQGKREEREKLRKFSFNYVLSQEQIRSGIDYLEAVDRESKTDGFAQIGLKIMEEGLYRMDAPKNDLGAEKRFTVYVLKTNRTKEETPPPSSLP